MDKHVRFQEHRHIESDVRVHETAGSSTRPVVCNSDQDKHVYVESADDDQHATCSPAAQQTHSAWEQYKNTIMLVICHTRA